MADIDRILQLKVALDTGELAAGLDATGSKMGTLGKQIGGFVKATGIGVALQGIDLLVGKVGEGVERSQEFETQAANLARALENVGAADQLDETLGAVSEKARNLGFDETEALLALNTILNSATSVEDAMIGLDAAFDLTRANPDEVTDLADAGTRLRDVFSGDFTASVDDFGASLEALTAGNVAEGFGHINTAAEDFAETTAGMQGVLDETITQGFAELGDVINQLALEIMPILINDVLPALHDLWVELQPVIDDVISVLQSLGDLIMELEPVWRPILETLWKLFTTTLGEIPGLIDTITESIGTISEAVQDVLDTVSGLVESVRQAFSDLASAITGPLSGVGDVIGGIGDIVGGILGRANAATSAANATLPAATAGATVNIYTSGNPQDVEAAVARAIRRSPYRNLGR